MSAISRNRGFTLLEILIALVLLSILTSALYASYFVVMRARDRASSGMESRRELGATLDLIRREVSSVAYNRDDKRLRFLLEDRDNFGAPSSILKLTTLSPPTFQNRSESGTVFVSYQMTDKNDNRILTRQEQDLNYTEAEVPSYPQMEQIDAFLVECYDGSKWVKSWDTAINRTLPKKVRVTVRVTDDGKPLEFSMISVPRVNGI